MNLEVGLIGVQHAIHPREELLSAMISVENDGTIGCATKSARCSLPLCPVSIRMKKDLHAIAGCDGSDEMSGSNGTSDGSFLVAVGETFTGEESGTTLRELEDDGGFDIPSGL